MAIRALATETHATTSLTVNNAPSQVRSGFPGHRDAAFLHLTVV